MKSNSAFLFLLVLTMMFCCLSFDTLQAQELSVTEQSKHAIGAAAGFTTGYGLSYRYTPGKWGLQATFAPFADEYETQISSGLTFMYYLRKLKFVNFYLYQGNHFFYERVNYPDYFNETKQWNNGVGMGFEFILFERVSVNLMTGFGAYDSFKKFNMTGETALYFKL
ncbi:MAG: hypothetical protein Q7J34_12395 [Bacteroidales bacterium]|jgi:hypothetical protein|nr:hypothetical protein [Bacteroidales bacterium]